MAMSDARGISADGRSDLGRALASGGRFLTPAGVASALDADTKTAAKKLARWAAQGWVRRVRRGLYIGVPAVLGSTGVERVIEMQLNDEEKAMLKVSADAVQSVVGVLGY